MSHYILTPVDFNPFEEERNIERIVITNEPQKEIWLSCIIGEHEANLAYNESVSLDLKGTFHAGYFIESVREVISRHEALRATISANGEALIIYDHLSIDVPVEDLTAYTDQKPLLDQFIAREMRHIFDLHQGPLFRAFLHKLNDNHYFFTIVKHHIIGDGWSTGVILEDLSKIYNAKVQGISVELEPAVQISDYAEEMDAFRQSPAYIDTERFWLNMYKKDVPVLDMPTDFPRPSTRTYKANRIDQQLTPSLVESLKKMGAKSGSSLVNTLLSAFEIFLYLQTNQRDIVVGLPAAGQAATGNFGLVGHCVNLLPLRSKIDPELNFKQYLKQRKGEFFDAYENQQFTFGQLIKKLNIKRDHSRIPLSPVIFNIDMGMDDAVQFNELDFELISNPRAYETFEIFLNATHSRSAFTLEWSYNEQLFKASTIEKYTLEFEKLLQSLVTEEDNILKDIFHKNTAAWRTQVQQWNDATTADYLKDIPFTTLIDQAASRSPNKTAISFNKETFTYSCLREYSNQFAAHLIEKGIKKGDIIGLATERSIEMLVALIGILKAGAVYIPLDPEYPQDRVEFMLADAQAKMLIVSKNYGGKFASDTDELVLEEIWAELGKYKTTNPVTIHKGTDLAYILYTSGSTGKPKGVRVMHQNLINLLTSIQSSPGITASDRMAAITTISFDIAAVELFLPLITGAEVVLCSRETARDGRLLIDVVEKKNITIMQATPSTWKMMIDSGWYNKYSLKIFCGGEALPKELASELLDRADELWNMYGPTETTIYSIIKKISREDENVSIGWPIRNTQTYILNAHHELAAQGNVGEIFIGGAGVAAGYLNRQDLTDERFIADPFSPTPGALMYQTGDLGKFQEDGDILYLGRADQQVKIRGFRIEPGEIESLLNELKDVKQAVVMAREDQPGDVRLVAYLVLNSDKVIYSAALVKGWKDSLKSQLPDFMMPADYIVMDSFPLTPNHKIDKKALPKPQRKGSKVTGTDGLPRDKNETMVAAIWSEILGIEGISIDDDFFDLGGHSLLAVRVMAGIEKETGKRLPLATLFENATIRSLAKKIDNNEDVKWNTLVPIKTSGTKDPVYLVHGGGLNVLLFASISRFLDQDQPVYGIQALGLNKPVPLLYSIEEIAATYLAEILEINPHGPYSLAGYSMGGKIAFEMAKQLKAMGKEIKLLGIIDTYATNTDTSSRSVVLTRKFIRQFIKVPFFFKSFLKHPKEAISYQVHMTKTRFGHLFYNQLEQGTEHFSPYEMEIHRSYDIAYSKYILKPSDLRIDLFRVKKRLYFLDDLVYLGWKKFAKQGISVHEIPGDHRTYLMPPNDQGFAQILQAVLYKN